MTEIEAFADLEAARVAETAAWQAYRDTHDSGSPEREQWQAANARLRAATDQYRAVVGEEAIGWSS